MLTLPQVERGYSLHSSGNYSSVANEFSTTNWIKSTNLYLDKIKKLTDENWNGIYEALYYVQVEHDHETKVEEGATAEEEEEPLLPDDPPTPPPN